MIRQLYHAAVFIIILVCSAVFLDRVAGAGGAQQLIRDMIKPMTTIDFNCSTGG